MRAWIDPIQAAKSASVSIASIRSCRKRLEYFTLKHTHLLLGGIEALAALLREFEAALVRGEGLFERQIAVLHLRDDALELREGLLETGFRGAF